MRYSRKAATVPNRIGHSRTVNRISYEKLAGRLASEMAACLRSKSSQEFRGPFQLVIVGAQGGVVFECQVGENGRVSHEGHARMVRRNHFPAMALLTDRTLVTRTFQIDHTGC